MDIILHVPDSISDPCCAVTDKHWVILFFLVTHTFPDRIILAHGSTLSSFDF
jgi:hypothetical protein